uniref:AAA family ATPase n=1 Tax=Prevotella sp. TaxID=59823 RepID=UPI003FF11BC3
MISQFSKELSEVLAFSREEADRLSCPSVAPEHLLLAVFRLSDPKIQRVISTLSLDVPTVKKELEQYASSNKEESKRIYEEINVTDRAANVLHLAVLEARIQHRKIVDVEDLILAILHDQTDTGAKMTLQAHHLDYIEANALLRQLANDVQGGLDLSDDDDDDMLFNDDEEEDREEARSQGGGAQQTRTKETKSATPALDNFGTDLTAAALEGKLDPVVGREREIIRVSEILGRRKKNNPVLIGEPGVGKSAIVEGLAQMIVQHRTSPTLFNKRIVSLDMTSIVAGTKYRGQFEERIRTILKEIERHPEVIVFIDEI